MTCMTFLEAIHLDLSMEQELQVLLQLGTQGFPVCNDSTHTPNEARAEFAEVIGLPSVHVARYSVGYWSQALANVRDQHRLLTRKVSSCGMTASTTDMRAVERSEDWLGRRKP